jgi:Kinetochore complex Sim4 subunit Fta1
MSRKQPPQPYPLYKSTYSLYRVSPLFHGKAPLLSNLNVHAKRLRDEITGDSMRGIQIANELAGITSGSTAGSLQSCTWDLLGDESTWERLHANEDEDEDEISALMAVNSQDALGIHVQVKYERLAYSAILLGDADRKTAISSFTSFPLLLLKMPAALRELFLNYLATTFDARVTPMKLRPHFLSSLLEHVLDSAVSTSDSGLDFDMTAFPRGLQLQLSFPSVTPNFKNMDISLSQEDLIQFLRQGQSLWDGRPFAATKSSASENLPPSKSPITGPFTAALSAYLLHHLALNFEHPAAVLDKIAVGPFAFGSDGRIKILESSSEAQEIWNMLLEHAQIQRMQEKDEILKDTEDVASQGSAMFASRRSSRIPTEPPPPYELHDPALRDDLD